ncbi:MAG: SDR family oxidoreductase [Anaerolineales bacterium]|nr:SDR family oxidoreductase [Anaerolineales bacterium]
MEFTNKVVLITGGSSGIGLALAKQLAERGARLALMARRQWKLNEAIASLEISHPGPAGWHLAVSADVSDALQVGQAVERVINTLGVPDLVINSAGVAHPGYVEELSLDIFRWMMEVNYFGTLHVIKALLPSMIERGSGHIVNISSIAGFIGVFGYTAYGASKYALRGFTDVLRLELKPKGIDVSIVFPPDTDTPQLAYENQFKPFETKELNRNGSCMSAKVVAREILKGVERCQYIIIPGLEGKTFYFLSSLVGIGVYPVMDYLVARAQRTNQRK